VARAHHKYTCAHDRVSVSAAATMGTAGMMAVLERGRSMDAGVRVLAVDDNSAFRTLLRTLVDATDGMEAVGEAGCGESALEVVEELEPDVVLMDIEMPGLDGLSASKAIKERFPSTVVVLVSATHPEELRPDAMTCSADEIVWKPHLRPQLLREIWERHRESGAPPAAAGA
jgi:DNA-binding NarL/FixJ family response regulator